jgi:hypothetical protein
MDFERSYPLPKNNAEKILVKWDKGYRALELWFNDELIGETGGANRLLKGVEFNNDRLGKVKVWLSEKPMVVNVIVDGYHSPINSLHPTKSMSSLSSWFFLPLILFVVSLIGIFFFNEDYSSTTFIIMALFATLPIIIFITSYILLRNRKILGFWLGYGYMLLLVLANVLSIIYMTQTISFGTSLIFLYFILMNIGFFKALKISKHLKLQKQQNLLDNSML